MEEITTLGIDLAKRVFALHGVNAAGQIKLRQVCRRDELVGIVAQLPLCLIGMEACSVAHDWAREFDHFGHAVRLMAPKFVRPYRKAQALRRFGAVAWSAELAYPLLTALCKRV